MWPTVPCCRRSPLLPTPLQSDRPRHAPETSVVQVFPSTPSASCRRPARCSSYDPRKAHRSTARTPSAAADRQSRPRRCRPRLRRRQPAGRRPPDADCLPSPSDSAACSDSVAGACATCPCCDCCSTASSAATASLSASDCVVSCGASPSDWAVSDCDSAADPPWSASGLG